MNDIDKYITTPKAISDDITTFCRTISAEQPVYVPVVRVHGTGKDNCFANVPAIVGAEGGSAVNGWTIWEWHQVLMVAEFHCNWRQPSGELIDITPKAESQILFLPDPAKGFTGERVPNRFHAAANDPLVTEWVALMTSIQKAQGSKVGLFSLSHMQFEILRTKGLDQQLIRKFAKR